MKVIPNAWGEKAVLKLMFAALVRAAEEVAAGRSDRLRAAPDGADQEGTGRGVRKGSGPIRNPKSEARSLPIIQQIWDLTARLAHRGPWLRCLWQPRPPLLRRTFAPDRRPVRGRAAGRWPGSKDRFSSRRDLASFLAGRWRFGMTISRFPTGVVTAIWTDCNMSGQRTGHRHTWRCTSEWHGGIICNKMSLNTRSNPP